ncbi:Isy1p Ecym_3566 [Eremothecium cymbalariae DBVPG|uniref:Pre-mRNA-splicing factor ISY1 n=1 Tax=Eremothecium cymbalariae (strain CBS 270.75 / DBVPG 7215 / KCTC 17166 / NRRL Y-17582) TaxID=931890 RepID=G8JQQ3_ERECY|nr:Hypothetical protein Ecym_3566 [Eremothecium cymbalariae DBVPG\
MSRNVDKANSVLVRYQELQAETESGYKDYSRFKRPTKIYKVSKLQEAQRWRNEVVKDIGNKITQIHDPSLNDFQVEEINGELNRLFQEKQRWENHIRRNLKGPDYRKIKGLNTSGGSLINGTRYFGRALELPHVQKMIKQRNEVRQKRLSKSQQEQQLKAKIRRWKKELGPHYYGNEVSENFLEYEEDRSQEIKLNIAASISEKQKPQCIISEFKDLPSLDDVERWLVEKRKKRLQEQLGL